ncbi:thioesterase II family protein [Nocardia salmonicida]|uniref:thioesterase II family protein n=1 Tax=Nocardia salmonicida TaxID=53431 RepID=UPI0037BA852E
MRKVATSSTSSYWRFDAETPACLRLVCFPHAGGSAGAYRHWSRLVSPETELCVAQYPGRQERFSEQAPSDLSALGAAVAAALHAETSVPTVLFGHSMGATIAAETAFGLHALGDPPALLVASASRAPGLHGDLDPTDHDDNELIGRMPYLSDDDRRAYADPDLGPLLTAVLRSDLLALSGHRAGAVPPLPTPVVCVAAADDPHFGADDAGDWQRFTEQPIRTIGFGGGHFYLSREPGAVVAAVEDLAREVLR